MPKDHVYLHKKRKKKAKMTQNKAQEGEREKTSRQNRSNSVEIVFFRQRHHVDDVCHDRNNSNDDKDVHDLVRYYGKTSLDTYSLVVHQQ